MSQTIPFGPDGGMDAAQRNRFPTCTYALTLAAGNTAVSTIFTAGFCRRIYCNTAGTLYVQRQGDAVLTPYTVVAGTVLLGIFVTIGGTTAGSTAATVNLEM
jgi:hypothetical protein